MSHSATLSNRRCASITNPNNLNSTSARPVAESALGAHPPTIVDSPTVGPSPLATNPYSSLIRLGGCSYDAGSSTSPPLHPPLQNCIVPMPQAIQGSVYSDSELISRCYGTDHAEPAPVQSSHFSSARSNFDYDYSVACTFPNWITAYIPTTAA
jgi:hypothetical protein